ncbi:hypothetical protein I317_01386 [Kwoniella heveanensis CBS 569]|nr:hypothetical protein I317_01386 [Kwoniella heveanensis CBS 569]
MVDYYRVYQVTGVPTDLVSDFGKNATHHLGEQVYVILRTDASGNSYATLRRVPPGMAATSARQRCSSLAEWQPRPSGTHILGMSLLESDSQRHQGTGKVKSYKSAPGPSSRWMHAVRGIIDIQRIYVHIQTDPKGNYYATFEKGTSWDFDAVPKIKALLIHRVSSVTYWNTYSSDSVKPVK